MSTALSDTAEVYKFTFFSLVIEFRSQMFWIGLFIDILRKIDTHGTIHFYLRIDPYKAKGDRKKKKIY